MSLLSFYLFFFNLEKRKIYVKFLSSVYFPFLVPRTVSLHGRFIVTASIVRDYFSSISFNDLSIIRNHLCQIRVNIINKLITLNWKHP